MILCVKVQNFPCEFLPSEKAYLIVFIILDSSGKYKECSFPTDVKMAASLTMEAIPPLISISIYGRGDYLVSFSSAAAAAGAVVTSVAGTTL